MQTIQYLKKKKMYELLKDMMEYEPSLMKNTSYKFYHGAEWLECSANDGEHFVLCKMYHEGSFISLDILGWNEEKCEYTEKERITYRLKNEEWVKTYQLTEEKKKIKEMQEWIDSIENKYQNLQSDNEAAKPHVRRRGR